MTTIGDIRELMEAAIGKLSPAQARQLAGSVMRGEGKDQISKAAKDLLEWSNKNRQRLTEMVRGEVRSQLAAMGVATKDEVDALKKRVRDLERGGAPKRTTAKKRTAARKPAVKKPAAAAPAEVASTPEPSGDGA